MFRMFFSYYKGVLGQEGLQHMTQKKPNTPDTHYIKTANPYLLRLALAE